ncbi:MAG: nicotinate-nucleotide adenylyltransferase [Acidobacteriia bacterium]|nr:nicotinate-nucleotide adenylyltransferase [Terriglobia bacterium]
MRVAIFGGTFDPIHRGHLRIARQVTRLLQLERVLFVTAARPPHKAAAQLTHACDRHAMVALALRSERRFVASNLELLSPLEKNYSIDTLAQVRTQLHPSDELFFIMGADQFAEFRTWRDSDRLLESVALVVVSRPGLAIEELIEKCDQKIQRAIKRLPGNARKRAGRSRRLSATPPVIFLVSDLKIDISSTSIRDRISAGRWVRGVLDPAVADYIRKNRLYTKRT